MIAKKTKHPKKRYFKKYEGLKEFLKNIIGSNIIKLIKKEFTEDDISKAIKDKFNIDIPKQYIIDESNRINIENKEAQIFFKSHRWLILYAEYLISCYVKELLNGDREFKDVIEEIKEDTGIDVPIKYLYEI